jgi:chromatin assembly factor 1 subunit A
LAYWDKEQQKSVEGAGEGVAEGNVSASPSHDIFKKSVSNKIKELATWLSCPDAGAMNGRMCWYVPPETRAAHGLPDITIPNTLWNYTFTPKRRESDIQTPTTGTALGIESNPKQLITKFTKKMTEVERRKQFSAAPVAEGTPDKMHEDVDSLHNNKTVKKFGSSSRAFTPFKTGEQRKRLLPSSLRKGQELSKACKNSLEKFMKQEGNSVVPHFATSDKPDPGVEECIVLSD